MRSARGVPGDDRCVLCWEDDCIGCAVLSPPEVPDDPKELEKG